MEAETKLANKHQQEAARWEYVVVEEVGAEAFSKALTEHAAKGWEVLNYTSDRRRSSGESIPLRALTERTDYSALLRRDRTAIPESTAPDTSVFEALKGIRRGDY